MVPSETSPKDPGSLQAGAIAARRWGARTGVSVRPLGQGSNNTLYLAVAGDERLVIKLSRPHREAAALDEYRKEAWCAGRARELDVATPEVLECGVFDGRAFQVQSFVDGRAPSASQALSTWQALGGYRAAHQFDPCCRMGPHPRSRRPLRRKLDGAPGLQHRGPRAGRRTGGARVPDRGLVAPAARRTRASRARGTFASAFAMATSRSGTP